MDYLTKLGFPKGVGRLQVLWDFNMCYGEKRFCGHPVLENVGLIHFLNNIFFFVDHLIKLVFLSIHYEIAKLNISKCNRSNGV